MTGVLNEEQECIIDTYETPEAILSVIKYLLRSRDEAVRLAGSYSESIVIINSYHRRLGDLETARRFLATSIQFRSARLDNE